MARKSNYNSVAANYNKFVANKEDGKKNTKVVCCMDCFWANLHRYGDNPVLAECRKKPDFDNEKFPYQVEVASARWICPTYTHQEGEKFIQKRPSKRSVA